MAVLGGIVGAVAGFLLALLITEVLAGGNLSNHPIDWAFGPTSCSRSSERSPGGRSRAASGPAIRH